MDPERVNLALDVLDMREALRVRREVLLAAFTGLRFAAHRNRLRLLVWAFRELHYAYNPWADLS